MENIMRSIMLIVVLFGVFLPTIVTYAAEPTVTELIAAVNSSDESARLVAIDRLGLMREKAADAVPLLAAALKDSSAVVRAHAAKALGDIGTPATSVVPELMTLTADKDNVVRREAIESIGRIHPDAEVSVPLFIKLIESSDPEARHAATTALTDQGKAAVPFLTKALSNEKATYWACIILGHIGPDAKDAVPALTELIDDKRSEVRREAILALANIGDASAPAIPQILKALDDPHAKTAAVFAIGELQKGTDEAEAKIRQYVDSSDQVLSSVSLWALARLHPDDKTLAAQATERLFERLKSTDPRARKAAAHALASLKPGGAIIASVMEKAFQGVTEETVHDALETLASLGPSTVPALIYAIKYENTRPYVVNLLGQQGVAAEPAVNALIKLLDDKNPDVQHETVIALGRIGPAAKAAVPALIEHLMKCMDNENQNHICYGIVYALGRIGSPDAVPILIQSCDSQDESLALFSAWALVQIQPTEPATATKMLPVLVRGLGSSEPRFRHVAADALRQLGPLAKPALPELQKALKDEDMSVRTMVEEAIKSVGG